MAVGIVDDKGDEPMVAPVEEPESEIED